MGQYELKSKDSETVKVFKTKGFNSERKYNVLNSLEVENENYLDAIFQGVSFDTFIFDKCHAANVDFFSCEFESGFFWNFDFLNCEFKNVEFIMHTMSNCIFQDCEFNTVNIFGTSWRNVSFQNCVFTDTVMDGQRNAGQMILESVAIIDCEIIRSSIKGAKIDEHSRLPSGLQVL